MRWRHDPMEEPANTAERSEQKQNQSKTDNIRIPNNIFHIHSSANKYFHTLKHSEINSSVDLNNFYVYIPIWFGILQYEGSPKTLFKFHIIVTMRRKLPVYSFVQRLAQAKGQKSVPNVWSNNWNDNKLYYVCTYMTSLGVVSFRATILKQCVIRAESLTVRALRAFGKVIYIKLYFFICTVAKIGWFSW